MELKHIPLADIEIGEIALRGAALEDEKFKGLMESIKLLGVQETIQVRKTAIPGKYFLINGLQRLTASNLLGLETIPASIIESADDAQVMKTQIQMNIHHVTTKPAEYGKQIRRIMALDPSLTVGKIANDLGMSTHWVTQRINLHTLLPELATLVDSGKISATNAFALAKLPQSEQKEWSKRAATQAPEVFVEACLTRAKELKDAARSGKKAGEEQFVAVKRLRSVADIKAEFESHQIRAKLVTANMTALDAFDAAIAWTLHQDNETVQLEREKWEAERAARAEKKAKAEAEKEAKKAAKAAAVEEAASTRDAVTE